jgi:hypothetical protein
MASAVAVSCQCRKLVQGLDLMTWQIMIPLIATAAPCVAIPMRLDSSDHTNAPTDPSGLATAVPAPAVTGTGTPLR